jgi:hypothetical protein
MSRVCEPVRVGVTGGGGCGLGICNPSLTRTRDTGSRVLPGESRIFKTHTNHPQTTTAHHNTKRARPPTNHHGCPLSKSTNNEEHTHARPSPTVTPNEYDRPRTATDNPLTTWDVYPNDSQLMTMLELQGDDVLGHHSTLHILGEIPLTHMFLIFHIPYHS